MSNIIITGGKGFVGKYLVEELRQAWPEVQIEVWDLPDTDITNPVTYRDRLKELQPAWVVHLAAISSVAAARENPAMARLVNVEATRQLLEQVEDVSPQTKVFVTSTADIYGSTSLTTGGQLIAELPLGQASPGNEYAKSKWEMEKMIEERFADRVLRVRPFPHIGPGQSLGFVSADFAAQIAAIEKTAASPEAPKGRRGIHRQPRGVVRVGNLEAQRDFTDVRDVARAYRLLMAKGVFGKACPAGEPRELCGVYHVASGKAVKIKDLLDMLLSLTEAKISVEQDPARMRPSDTPVLVGDASKLTAATGWQPEIPLEQTLADILNWWRGTMSARV